MFAHLHLFFQYPIQLTFVRSFFAHSLPNNWTENWKTCRSAGANHVQQKKCKNILSAIGNCPNAFKQYNSKVG